MKKGEEKAKAFAARGEYLAEKAYKYQQRKSQGKHMNMDRIRSKAKMREWRAEGRARKARERKEEEEREKKEKK